MWQDNRPLEEAPLWLIIWESEAPQHGKTNPSSGVIRAVSLTLALGLPCLGGFMGWGKLDLPHKGQGDRLKPSCCCHVTLPAGSVISEPFVKNNLCDSVGVRI